MINQELTYWMTLALIPKMWTKRKNEIYVNCFRHNPQISIIEMFENEANWDLVGLNEEEKEQFRAAKTQLANNSFLVEELKAQGYEILPITCDDYPKTLKKNLGYNSPTVIYSKGDKSLLQAPSIAIVGSRNADDVSLHFTENIAQKTASSNKVVISGFAKGVDRKALDSALVANGKSIIVLPQGIMTFGSGFKQYFKDIVQGKVLVMSTFAPKAPWSVEFAMARNSIIYGMASEIFVAQSDDKGGTWAGVTEGLRKKRPIFVRYPQQNEKNANLLLIQKGAQAVDINGQALTLSAEEQYSPQQLEEERQRSAIIEMLRKAEQITPAEIISRLGSPWKPEKMTKYLEGLPQVEKIKVKNRNYFRMKGKGQPSLFENQLY